MQLLAETLSLGGSRHDRHAAEHVLGHVRRVLKSRQHQSLSAPGYGVAIGRDALQDNMMQLPHSLPLIESLILRALQHSELRLTHWRLAHPSKVVADTLTLFVAARYRDDAARQFLHTIEVVPSGRILVR